MWLRRLAAVIAVLVAAGCSSSAQAPPPVPRGAPAAGYAGYWTAARLMAASPMRGQENLQMPAGQSARPAAVAPRVGALFVREPGGNHFCTASPVTSPGKDLLITAAHCVSAGSDGGSRQDLVFIPGYRDGQAPYGVWVVRKVFVPPQWARASDPAFDVGFVVVAPHDGKNIEDVLGANKLAVGSGYVHLVRVTGYPDSADSPVTCFTWTARQSATQMRMECAGFSGGTSGSPWLTGFNPQTRDGTIVGVIGGYQEGGNTDAVSYSSYLGPEAETLYKEASGS
jgi:V8-like Glu-specific endopeptidase